MNSKLLEPPKSHTGQKALGHFPHFPLSPLTLIPIKGGKLYYYIGGGQESVQVLFCNFTATHKSLSFELHSSGGWYLRQLPWEQGSCIGALLLQKVGVEWKE